MVEARTRRNNVYLDWEWTRKRREGERTILQLWNVNAIVDRWKTRVYINRDNRSSFEERWLVLKFDLFRRFENTSRTKALVCYERSHYPASLITIFSRKWKMDDCINPSFIELSLVFIYDSVSQSCCGLALEYFHSLLMYRRNEIKIFRILGKISWNRIFRNEFYHHFSTRD